MFYCDLIGVQNRDSNYELRMSNKSNYQSKPRVSSLTRDNMLPVLVIMCTYIPF
jgi:hypothetical protein